jgi:hypothetical protein
MTEQDALELEQLKSELRAVSNFNSTRMDSFVERVERLRKYLPPAVLIEEILKVMEDTEAANQFIITWKTGFKMRVDLCGKRISPN